MTGPAMTIGEINDALGIPRPITITVHGQPAPQGLPETFLRHVEFTDTCWPWTGATTNGYGQYSHGGRLRGAHRVAHELLVGPIPDGLVLDHLCRNRACVNPAHLEPVTNRENIIRGTGWAARNAAQTHCPQGHPYDEANTYMDQGRRKCRACIADRRKAPEPTTCRNGHPLEGNRYVSAGGEAKCRTCEREKRRRYRQRRGSR